MDFSTLFKQGAKLKVAEQNEPSALRISTSAASTLASQTKAQTVPITTPKQQVQSLLNRKVVVNPHGLSAKISPKGADKTLHMNEQALSVLASLGSSKNNEDSNKFNNSSSMNSNKKRTLSSLRESSQNEHDKNKNSNIIRKKTKQQSEPQVPRSNCWSYEEEVVLIGAVMDRFLTYGSLVSARRRKKKLGVEKGFVEAKHKFAPKIKNKDQIKDADDIGEVDDQECWTSIKEVYDEGLKILGDASSRPVRSMNALCRHYKVMKARKEIKFQDLFDAWLETDYAAELRNQVYSDGEQENNMEVEKDKQRSNSWKREEEVMLIGAVVTRFLEFGSLVKKKQECWGQIQATFELAWGNYARMFNVSPSYIRTVNALHRHYKVMKARRSNLYPYYNEWRVLTSGSNSILNPKSSISNPVSGSATADWSGKTKKKAHWLKVENNATGPPKDEKSSKLASSKVDSLQQQPLAMKLSAVDNNVTHRQLNYAHQLQNQVAVLGAGGNGSNISMIHNNNISNSMSSIHHNNGYSALSMMGVFGNMPPFGNIQNTQMPNISLPNMQTMLNQMALMNGLAPSMPQLQNSNVMNTNNLANFNMQMANINRINNMANLNMNMNNNSNNLMCNVTGNINEMNAMTKSQAESTDTMRSNNNHVSTKQPETTKQAENKPQESDSQKQQYPKQFPRESFRERYNCWTSEEEVILVGIVVERFLSRGSLVSHRKRKDGESKDENDLECWNSIHECFEKALSKHCEMQNQQRPQPRSTLAMRRHYKVIKSKRNQGELRKFYTKWKSSFNKDKVLFDNDEVRIQEIKDEDASSWKVSELDNGSSRDRWDSWIHLEEVMLIGCVVERFLKFGSLVSVRKKGENGVEVDDCWQDIKSCYDNAWEIYQQKSGESRPCERSSNALSRHYKVMKARRRPCGRLANELGKYFDEWCVLKDKFPQLFLAPR